MMGILQKIKCGLGYHKFEHIQKLSHIAERVGCPCCNRTWAISHEHRSMLEWDSDLEDLYANVMEVKLISPPWIRA